MGLITMHFGDQGAEVREVQEGLIDEGYQLPKYGADGDYGDETKTALKDLAKDEGLPWSDPLSKELLDVLLWSVQEDPDVLEAPTIPASTRAVEIIDFRDKQVNPPEMARKFKRARGKVVVRDPAQVTGITIHQTAVKYNVAEYQVYAAGGSRKQALCYRALNMACHVATFHDGFVVWANSLDWYVYHGNGFNAFELGLEIDGNYPGLYGGKTWNKKRATQTTAASIEAARAGIALLVTEGRKMGMPIEYIHAHRQSSVTRRGDPGEELWKSVVLEYAVPALGLITEPARYLRGRRGNGRPIPPEWDTDGVGTY